MIAATASMTKRDKLLLIVILLLGKRNCWAKFTVIAFSAAVLV
jgi:hypothetical protein